MRGLPDGLSGMACSGTVYGTLLNERGALAALGDAVNQPPYLAPPKAPILYIKPVNTLIPGGAPIPVPPDAERLEMGAALGLVIGRSGTRLTEQNALDHLRGAVLINDVSVPHASYFRPAIRQRCRDGFCPVGVLAPLPAAWPGLALRIAIDGRPAADGSLGHLVRPLPRLLADVTAFMTLEPGDILHAGVVCSAAARAGQRVRIEADGFPPLENPLAAEIELLRGAA